MLSIIPFYLFNGIEERGGGGLEAPICLGHYM